jgi:hypothetical protein
MLDILNRRRLVPAGEPAIAPELADELADMLEGRIATEDPASPDFDPAFGLPEPAPEPGVLDKVGVVLVRSLEYHRGEVNRLAGEIDAIRKRADDAIASREALRRQHEDALDIWSAADDRHRHIMPAVEGGGRSQAPGGDETASASLQ